MSRRSLRWMLAVLSLALLLGVGFRAGAFPGFHDDTGSTCLGPDDPDPSCGGGGTTNCLICRVIRDGDNVVQSVACVRDSSGQGNTCQVWWNEDDAGCNIGGSC